jgi:hypothetical protein
MLSTIEMIASIKFAVTAGVSLLLVVAETLYLYVALLETYLGLRNLPASNDDPIWKSPQENMANGMASMNGHFKLLLNGDPKDT